MKDVLTAVVALILLAVVWGGWQIFVHETQKGKSDEQVFCTADAKMCPGGSYVGRVGPNCEFAACPGE